MCYSGVSGFLWVAITQLIIVIMSLIMLTFRIGYFNRNEIVDEAFFPTSTASNEAIINQDNTMIIEDEDDDKHVIGRESSEWEVQGGLDDYQQGTDMLRSSSPPAVMFDATAQMMAIDSQAAKTHSQSIPRRHNFDETGGTVHRNNKRLISTSQNSVQASSFERDEMHNVEVCLNNDANNDDGVRMMTTSGQCGGSSSSSSQTQEHERQLRLDYYSESLVRPSTASKSSTATANVIAEEVIRVRERLQDIKERRGRLTRNATTRQKKSAVLERN